MTVSRDDAVRIARGFLVQNGKDEDSVFLDSPKVTHHIDTGDNVWWILFKDRFPLGVRVTPDYCVIEVNDTTGEARFVPVM